MDSFLLCDNAQWDGDMIVGKIPTTAKVIQASSVRNRNTIYYPKR